MTRFPEAPRQTTSKEAFLTTLKERYEIKNIRPWDLLWQISRIPRQSKQEGPITTFMEQLSHSQGWITERDGVDNLLVHVPATKGYEDAPITILHFHPDMVCKKTKGSPYDPAVNGVNLVFDRNGWVKADGTSAGFDDGAGLVTAFSIAMDKPHGRLMLLSTVDEDGDFTGVNNLSFRAIKDADFLINLDNEDSGEITIGCAGGDKRLMAIPIERESSGHRFYLKLTLRGLKGGHSGVAIQEKHTNAIKAMAKIARNISDSARLVSFSSGELNTVNVIPDVSEMVIAVDPKDIDLVDRQILETVNEIEKNVSPAERKTIEFTQSPLTDEENPGDMITQQSAETILTTIENLPHGVSEMQGKNVITSSNLATIATDNNTVIIGTMSRSAKEGALSATVSIIDAIAKRVNTVVNKLSRYPAWEPVYDSPLVKLAQAVRKRIKGLPFKVGITHGGLELGIIVNKWPRLLGKAVALGPTIKDPHSVNERMLIKSVDEIYEVVAELLKEIAEVKVSVN